MKILTLLFSALTLTLSACLVTPDGRIVGPAVVVEAGHVCGHHCDHHYHGGRWQRSHKHGHGCGHTLRGGIWVTIH